MSGISKRSNRAIAVETETMNKEAGVVSLMEAAPEEPEDFEADTEEKAHHEYDEKKQTKDPPAAQFEHPKSIKATTPNVMFHLPPEDPTQPLPARQLINQAKAASTQALYGNDIIAEVKEGEEGEELPSSILFSGDPYGGTTNSIRTETSFMTPLPHRENIIDLDVLKDQVFFVFPDWRRRLSKFSLLIVLSSIIATCGIIADSTATVIGAMIVVSLRAPFNYCFGSISYVFFK